MAGKTIVEAAQVILSDGRELYYAKIADEAQARGYEGRKSSSQDSIRQSFFATMNRNKDVFQGTGDGKYKLRQNPSADN